MTPAYDPAPNVAMVIGSAGSGAPADRVLYLAPLPDGPVMVLNGIAALLYEELTSDEPGEVSTRLAARLGVALADVDDDGVDELAREFVNSELIFCRGTTH